MADSLEFIPVWYERMTETRLKAAKKVLDMANWDKVVNQAISMEDDEDLKKELKDTIELEIQEHVSQAISFAIPRTLYLKMFTAPWKRESVVNIRPFVYRATATESGKDAVSINPSFNMDNDGGIWKIKSIDKKPHKNSELIYMIAKDIDDEILLSTVSNFISNWEYDTMEKEWIKNDPKYPGLSFSNEEIKLLLTIHVLSILHELARSWEDDDLMEVEVPFEGIYFMTVAEDKSIDVKLKPSKEYKATVKNDKLTVKYVKENGKLDELYEQDQTDEVEQDEDDVQFLSGLSLVIQKTEEEEEDGDEINY